ncbi:hypothetical protein TNCV_3890181 [Trichonephila clavipes]|nr:hypothetical protein TNCV_3890181 [Trichonephila clavipes]
MSVFKPEIRDAHNLSPTNHTVTAFLNLPKAFDRSGNHKFRDSLPIANHCPCSMQARVASASNLDKLERVQLSAARIITGLRNSCPRDLVLQEADLQPLRF